MPTRTWKVSHRACLPILAAIVLSLGGCGGGGSGGRVPPTQPPVDPPTDVVTVEPVFAIQSFVEPLAMLQAPGDSSRWFVVVRRGIVKVFPTTGAVPATDFLDISSRVAAGGSEQGLLGFAFDPDYATNGYVYASYTAATPSRSVISRFTLNGTAGVIDPSSELVLLEVPQPASNHNGGHLAFGPDGYLYAGFGDGGGSGDPFGNGQDTTTLLGAILRLDVSAAPPYAIPADNPFDGNTECFTGSGTDDCPEIYAWGFRNPWRFSFDMDSGDLWVGDVGQNAWEEIDRVTDGQNYGWNDREGAHCYPPTATTCDEMNVDPITEYPHGPGQSVTGGYVYRGDDYPGLAGQYLFGDFVSGQIWRVPATAAQGTEPVLLADTTINISSFGQSNDGEIYVVGYGGKLYRVVDP